MSVEHFEVLVEEPSMEALLQVLLPGILGTVEFRVHAFQCKAELLKHLPNRLRGYKPWLPEYWRILVIVDRDDTDCTALKENLEKMARDVHLPTRSSRKDANYTIINRLAIEELEAWYFGDWEAVRRAYPRVPATIPKKKPYRDPDAIAGGTWEAFERILKNAGYFTTGLRKVEAARTIARYMEPVRNTSHSFRVLFDALSEIRDA
jgi:hypothetical protein